jgi:hypothetical protein
MAAIARGTKRRALVHIFVVVVMKLKLRPAWGDMVIVAGYYSAPESAKVLGYN